MSTPTRTQALPSLPGVPPLAANQIREVVKQVQRVQAVAELAVAQAQKPQSYRMVSGAGNKFEDERLNFLSPFKVTRNAATKSTDVGFSQSGSGVESLNGLIGALTLLAGANITITPSGDTLTIAATTGAGGVSSLNGETGALSLLAGANISISVSGPNITIAVTGLSIPNFADAEAVTFTGTSFTLAYTPSPASSLILFKVPSGSNPFCIPLVGGGINYSLSGATGTLVASPDAGDSGVAWYRY